MIDLKPACERIGVLLAGVADNQLDGATPCTEYAVRDLVGHVEEVSVGLASLARKSDDVESAVGIEPGWRERVAARVRELGQAWDEPAAWEGLGAAAGLELSNELWGKIAFTEIVVHGWDLAKATGQPFELPDESLRACLEHVADFVPKAPIPSLWGPTVEVSENAPLIDRIVGITGRTP